MARTSRNYPVGDSDARAGRFWGRQGAVSGIAGRPPDLRGPTHLAAAWGEGRAPQRPSHALLFGLLPYVGPRCALRRASEVSRAGLPQGGEAGFRTKETPAGPQRGLSLGVQRPRSHRTCFWKSQGGVWAASVGFEWSLVCGWVCPAFSISSDWPFVVPFLERDHS